MDSSKAAATTTQAARRSQISFFERQTTLGGSDRFPSSSFRLSFFEVRLANPSPMGDSSRLSSISIQNIGPTDNLNNPPSNQKPTNNTIAPARQVVKIGDV